MATLYLRKVLHFYFESAPLWMDRLEERWAKKYPIVIRSLRNNRENLSQYFKYPEDIRRIIYTTNTTEAVHRQFRKLTKTKGAFPNENSLLKLLYLGIQNASKKWTMPIQNWSLSISHSLSWLYFLKVGWIRNYPFVNLNKGR